MEENKKPDCFNRPDVLDEYEVRDGWQDIEVITDYGFVEIVTSPVFKTIKSVFNNDCNMIGEFGAATLYNWNCKGCKHFKE